MTGLSKIVNKQTVALPTQAPVEKSPVKDYTQELGLKALMVGRLYFQFSTDLETWYASQGTHLYMRISGDGKMWSPGIALKDLNLSNNIIGRAPIYDDLDSAPTNGVDTGLYVIGGLLYQFSNGKYVILSSAEDEEPFLTKDIVCVNAGDMGREDGYIFPEGMTFTQYVEIQHRRANVVYYYLPEIIEFTSSLVKVEVGTALHVTLNLSWTNNDSAGISTMRYKRGDDIIYQGGKNLSFYDSEGVAEMPLGDVDYSVEVDYLAPDVDKTNKLGEVDTTNKFSAGTKRAELAVNGDYRHISVTLGYDPGVQGGSYFRTNNVLSDVWSDEDYILPLDGVKFIAILVPPNKVLDLDNTVNPAALNDKVMANAIVTTNPIEVPIGGTKTASYTLYRYLAAVAYSGAENELHVKFKNA